MKNNRHIRDLKLQGLDPKLFPPERHFEWLVKPRLPVVVTEDPLTNMFIQATITNEACKFIYIGGSTPGLPRSVHVSMVFHHHRDSRIYVAGFCPERCGN
ncbi:MAG TPA: hypothetical protein VHB20_03455 [Verrucomicrobiae bacterium]|jgi:hypothetical protein|nr:hypothetical protein [Verrucomicrobiae bacterium]